MIPNIVRGSDPAGLVRYLFGKGRRNEHTDQHLVCASGDMFPSFDMDGKPAASYAEIGRRFDRRYRVRERKDDPFPPDMRLKRLRDDWADDARSRALAVQEWRAAMENRPPFLDDGRERHLENLSTHDMERLVSEAFCIAASLNNAADDDEYRAAMREGLHTFDMLRERYGIAPEYGLWSMVASDEENRPRR